MKETAWSIDPAAGELRIRTGVAGRAAKMGHRLTIAMNSWEATVQWAADKPKSAELTVGVDSLAVISSDGGIKALGGPEKAVARSNAPKSLNAKKFPQIRFVADDIAKIADGYRLTGSSSMDQISRDPQNLASQTLNASHQYPDGFLLFLGTLFAPTEDRDHPGSGFTHKIGDRVSISSPRLGALHNQVTTSDKAAPWTFGVTALLKNLIARGLLG